MSPSLYRRKFESSHRRPYLPGCNAPDRGDRPRGRGAHRRSTTLLAQTVEHSGLKATDRSTTRHLRLDLGADEGRAGPRAEQASRPTGLGSALDLAMGASIARLILLRTCIERPDCPGR